MATYTQWRAGADHGEVRRLAWVCGEQTVLVEEVVDTTRQLLAVGDLDYTSFTAGSDPETAIWAAVHQYRITNHAGLIVVRQAHLLRRWQTLIDWARNLRAMPGQHLLFVAGEPDFPYVGDAKRGTLKPHVELIKNKGRIVRCAMPAEPDAVAWLRRRAPLLTDVTAAYVLTRTGGDLTAAGNVAAKLALFDTATVTLSTVDAVVDEQPGRSFVDNLLAGDKRAAVMGIAGLDRTERGRIIGLLDVRIDTLAQLWQSVRAGHSLREVTGVNPYLARLYLPIAKHYNPQRCAYIRRLLAVVDDAHRSGADEGVMEALVALF